MHSCACSHSLVFIKGLIYRSLARKSFRVRKYSPPDVSLRRMLAVCHAEQCNDDAVHCGSIWGGDFCKYLKKYLSFVFTSCKDCPIYRRLRAFTKIATLEDRINVIVALTNVSTLQGPLPWSQDKYDMMINYYNLLLEVQKDVECLVEDGRTVVLAESDVLPF